MKKAILAFTAFLLFSFAATAQNLGVQNVASVVTFSATPTFNAASAGIFIITLTGNVTSLTISNPSVGETLTFVISQDATGSRTWAWPSTVKNAPAISAGASTITTVTMNYDGSNWQTTGSAVNSAQSLNLPTIVGGLTASGSVANDFSGSTGSFKTSTGAATFGGSANSFASAVTPTAAGGQTVGSAALPFSSAFIGGAATNNFQITGTATGARTVTLPDVSTVVIPVMNHSATAVNASTLHIVRDTCTLGTNCTVTLTGAAVFADTNYACGATDATGANAVKIANTAGNTVTITGTGTDVINYVCVGN